MSNFLKMQNSITTKLMEKNKQQSAVEWLFHLMPPEYKMKQSALDAYGQALEIEKDQIEDAYIMGSYDMASKEFKPGKYYNEIYGKD